MASSHRIDASRAVGALQVEHCDIPAEMTLAEWRRHCCAEQRAAAEAERSNRRGTVGRGLRRALRLA